MIAQAQIYTVGCTIALNRDTKAVAFNRPKQLPAFIEERPERVVWEKGSVRIGDKDYVYNAWHSVEAEENKPLKDYIQWLVENDYEPPVFQSFRF